MSSYICKVCRKYKDETSFSKNELKRCATKAMKADLRCRGCTGGAVTEKQCEGPCKQFKDLQKFSKSSRSNGGNQYCQECTVWKDSIEHGVVAENPPGDDGDSDDNSNGGVYSDPEAGDSGSDYEDYARPPTSVASRNVAAPRIGTRQPPSAITGSIAPRQHIQVPYHGLAAMSLTGNNTSNSDTGRTMDTAKLSAPTMSGPGARNIQVQYDIRSESSVSNPYEQNTSTSTTQAPAWGAMDARRRAPVTFNAWDNKGQAHSQQKVASGSGSVYTPTPPNPPAATTRLVGSRQPPQATAPGSRPVPPQTQARSVEDSDSEDDLYTM
ncbi:uncharacterized protein RAG0_07784 [Rhynchosporium agropyri]|uniref:Stc1 domain-containing protein n=1 Tax=Rhynchosporium agropyri TaxID=914238 RepID=A0A1E1KN84_9HELO|nr:uncharacterized protein RAG0_07784 [Rhynchosporium agropyri]